MEPERGTGSAITRAAGAVRPRTSPVRHFIGTTLACICAPVVIAAIVILAPFAAVGLLIDSLRHREMDGTGWWNEGAHLGRWPASSKRRTEDSGCV